MARFTYKDRLVVVCTEMSRAAALRVAQSVNMLVDLAPTLNGTLTNELDTIYVLNTPCSVLLDSKVLDTGTHSIDLDGQAFSLTLPLTRECFDALPVSLTAQWISAAQTENQWLTDFFLSALKAMAQPTGAPQSDKAPS